MITNFSHASRSLSRLAALGCITLLTVLLGQAAYSQTYTVLYSFNGIDGSGPAAAPIMDNAGNLYGTTATGGILVCNKPSGCGLVYKVSAAGKLSALHRFSGQEVYRSTYDGSLPEAALIADSAGNLYGTTYQGGNGCEPSGCGTAFKFNTGNNQESIMYSFVGSPSDGNNPAASLYENSAGEFFGTTGSGGIQSVFGIAFMLTPTGQETVLHFFSQSPDGAFPSSGFVPDSAGNLYGVTSAGGSTNSNCMGVGCGTVYELASPDWTESVIYEFQGGSDGLQPNGNLLRDSSGNFYGVTAGGGNTNCGSFGCGTIFKLTPSSTGWTESILYHFTGASDGANPKGALVKDSSGNLYGVNSSGGDANCHCGVVFKLDPSGVLTVLHSFTGNNDGSYPTGLLLDQSTSTLYGTTGTGGNMSCSQSGQLGCGVLFKIKL